MARKLMAGFLSLVCGIAGVGVIAFLVVTFDRSLGVAYPASVGKVGLLSGMLGIWLMVPLGLFLEKLDRFTARISNQPDEVDSTIPALEKKESGFWQSQRSSNLQASIAHSRLMRGAFRRRKSIRG